MKIHTVLATLLTVATLNAAPAGIGKSFVPTKKTHTQLTLEMRKLWEQHIIYTRNYIICAIANLPDTEAIAARLLRNQDDIGNAFMPYYGEAAGSKLTVLLRDHIMIASEVVKAAKSGRKAAVDSIEAKWSANSRDVANFLCSVNPNWPLKEMKEMLQDHLNLTTGEVVGRLAKDWAKDISSFDEGHDHMMMFADILTDGIVKQFPEKFK